MTMTVTDRSRAGETSGSIERTGLVGRSLSSGYNPLVGFVVRIEEAFAMVQVDVLRVQADLTHYLEQVARGETIVVTRDNEPIAELRPVASPVQTPRAIGLARGTFEIPKSFYEPLPADLIESFYGEGS
jgi:antitoxin (DNA-binding transcriptional repressor) of toxin-antitoxin stability system